MDDVDKKIYCLKRVLSLDSSHNKAQQLLEKLQAVQQQPNNQKSVSRPQLQIAPKKVSLSWLPISIAGIAVVVILCIVIGVALSSRMNIFQPTPTSIPTRIPPTRTPRPSPTPSIFTGDPIQYLPNLPDNYDIDYEIPNVNTTLQDGTVLYSIGFRNREAIFPGDLVTVVYYINIYPSKTKAISEYQRYLGDLAMKSKGTLDSDIGIDGTDASAVFIQPQGDNIVLAQYVSRVNNVFITTMGLTSYDPQNLTDAFMKSLMANVAKVHILGIDKLSK